MDDSRRLVASLPHSVAVPFSLGCWYRVHQSDSLFYVFTLMQGGILVPCGAEIAQNGKVIEIIPLGSHARQIMGRIPQGLIQVYIRRIESAAATVFAGIARDSGDRDADASGWGER